VGCWVCSMLYRTVMMNDCIVGRSMAWHVLWLHVWGTWGMEYC